MWVDDKALIYTNTSSLTNQQIPLYCVVMSLIHMGGLKPFPDVTLHILDDSKLVWSQDWKGAELTVVSYIVMLQSGKQ